jgi:hypothetical protein
LTNAFQKKVDELNTTQTNLMNEILKNYLYWSTFIMNHESPFLTFDNGTFVALIEAIDDAKLENIVKETATEAAIDFIKFRWRKLNFRNIVRYLDLLSSYANVGSITMGRLNGENGGVENGNIVNYRVDNGNIPGNNHGYEKYEIAVRHHLGKKWSKFMAMYISNIFAISIPMTQTNYEISNRSCFVYLNMGLTNGA